MTIDKDSSLKELLQVLENRVVHDIPQPMEAIGLALAQGTSGVKLSLRQQAYFGQILMQIGLVYEGLNSMKTIIQWAKDKIEEGEKND